MERRNFMTILKGAIIGGTMVVPGMSGGSMAMILGIYDRLITSVSSFSRDKKHNLLFLMIFSVGGLLGLVLFSKPMLWLLETYPKPMLYFFIGAVAGGTPMIFQEAQVQKIRWQTLAWMAAGMMIVLLFSRLPQGNFQSQGGSVSFSLLIAGILAAAALILPGISVSYLFLIMGLYEEIMAAVSGFHVHFLAPLGIGLLLGILAMTKALEYAMKRFPQPTYLLILGFVLGSIAQVFPGLPALAQLPVCALMFAGGFAAIFLLSGKNS